MPSQTWPASLSLLCVLFGKAYPRSTYTLWTCIACACCFTADRRSTASLLWLKFWVANAYHTSPGQQRALALAHFQLHSQHQPSACKYTSTCKLHVVCIPIPQSLPETPVFSHPRPNLPTYLLFLPLSSLLLLLLLLSNPFKALSCLVNHLLVLCLLGRSVC